MADVNLPSINELSQMQFLPAAQYQMARDNIGLANQFQQQNLQQGDANLQAALLKNTFDAQNNPISLQGNQGVANTRTAEGILKGIDAQQRQGLAPQEMEAKRAKFITEASDSKLADLINRTQSDMMDSNASPEKQQAAKEAFERSSKEWAARLKAKDEVAKQAEELKSKQGIAQAEIAGRADVANIAAGSREKVAAMKQKQQASYESALAGAKNYDSAANIAEAYASSAGEDTGRRDYYLSEAKRFQALALQKATASAGIKAGQALDLPAMQQTGQLSYQPNPTNTVPQPTARVPGMSGPQGPTNPSERKMASEISNGEFDPLEARKHVVQYLKDANDPSKPLTQGERDMFRAEAQQLQKQIDKYGNAPAAPTAQPTVRADGKVNVINPNGTPGWISKADLAEALKNGWKTK